MSPSSGLKSLSSRAVTAFHLLCLSPSLGLKSLSSRVITGVSEATSMSPALGLKVPVFSCYYRRFRDYEYVCLLNGV
jgi:hypothetical protein